MVSAPRTASKRYSRIVVAPRPDLMIKIYNHPQVREELAWKVVRYFDCARCGRAIRMPFPVVLTADGALVCFLCATNVEVDQRIESIEAYGPPPKLKRDRKRPPPDERDCDHCGAGYTPKRSDSRYCSGRCRTAAHRSRTPTA